MSRPCSPGTGRWAPSFRFHLHILDTTTTPTPLPILCTAGNIAALRSRRSTDSSPPSSETIHRSILGVLSAHHGGSLWLQPPSALPRLLAPHLTYITRQLRRLFRFLAPPATARTCIWLASTSPAASIEDNIFAALHKATRPRSPCRLTSAQTSARLFNHLPISHSRL